MFFPKQWRFFFQFSKKGRGNLPTLPRELRAGEYSLMIWATSSLFFHYFFKLGFSPCKVEQPPRGMELQEKEEQKD